MEKLSHDRKYWSLLKVRLPSINILGKEAAVGENYLTPTLTLTQGRHVWTRKNKCKLKIKKWFVTIQIWSIFLIQAERNKCCMNLRSLLSGLWGGQDDRVSASWHPEKLLPISYSSQCFPDRIRQTSLQIGPDAQLHCVLQLWSFSAPRENPQPHKVVLGLV